MRRPLSTRDGTDFAEMQSFHSPASLEEWRDFIGHYSSLIYSIPRRFGLSANDSDDVFQATCLTAVRRRDSLPPPDRLAGWLVSIASWESRRVLRRRSPMLESPEMLDAIPELGASPPAEVVARVERHRILLDAMATLSDRDRDVLRSLFLAEDPVSYEDLAERFGIALGTVGPIRCRALQRLRRELERRGF